MNDAGGDTLVTFDLQRVVPWLITRRGRSNWFDETIRSPFRTLLNRLVSGTRLTVERKTRVIVLRASVSIYFTKHSVMDREGRREINRSVLLNTIKFRARVSRLEPF